MGMIVRAKGIVQGTDGNWMEFDLTPGEFEIRNCGADYTGRICVIGTTLDEKKLLSLFGIE